MAIYEDSKRVCARAICFINDKVILMKRHREVGQPLGDYYVIPGGGVEEGEEKEVAAIRELDEETCVKAEILEFLEREDYGTGISNAVYYVSVKDALMLHGDTSTQILTVNDVHMIFGNNKVRKTMNKKDEQNHF